MQSSISKTDRAFEIHLILLGVLQSTLYRFLLWLTDPSEGIEFVLVLTAVFILPFFISLYFWVKIILDSNINHDTIKFRLISWSSLYSGFMIFHIIIISIILVRDVRKWFVFVIFIVLDFVINGLKNPIRNIIENYKSATPDFKLWNKWYFLKIGLISQAIIPIIVITILLYFYMLMYL